MKNVRTPQGVIFLTHTVYSSWAELRDTFLISYTEKKKRTKRSS